MIFPREENAPPTNMQQSLFVFVFLRDQIFFKYVSIKKLLRQSTMINVEMCSTLE